MKPLRLCFPQARRSRKLRRDSCFHNLNGYPIEKFPVPQASHENNNHETRHDITTSARQDVNYRAWKDVIENTETHNSALRLTREERYDVEDVVSDLERTHHIKTSMNELARLGLLSILRDYKQRTQQSLVYKVKKA